MIQLWAREFDLENKIDAARSLFHHALENFYMQLTVENLSRAWLTDYFTATIKMVADIKKHFK